MHKRRNTLIQLFPRIYTSDHIYRCVGYFISHNMCNGGVVICCSVQSVTIKAKQSSNYNNNHNNNNSRAVLGLRIIPLKKVSTHFKGKKETTIMK